MLSGLAWKSLNHRRLTSVLTITAIALAVGLFLGIERIRTGVKQGFAGTIAKTDLIVGARSGPMQLLLYSVFHIGNATNNIDFKTYQKISQDKRIKWTIPISLGDSHRGFRVVGTSSNFYRQFRYRGDGRIAFAEGRAPQTPLEVVLGAEVAKRLGYSLQQSITLSHGMVADGHGMQDHDRKPFTITGILQPTGTPVDSSLYIDLLGMEALHLDWSDGAPPTASQAISRAAILKADYPVKSITAFFLGAERRIDTLYLQRAINEHTQEPLTAILPGIVLDDLWQVIGYAENSLLLVSALVVIMGLISMLIALYHSLNERRREMAILRSVGAGPTTIFRLLVGEAFTLTAAGCLLGWLLTQVSLMLLGGWLNRQFAMDVPISWISAREAVHLLVVLSCGMVLGLIPAYRAYKNTLSDGLSPKV